MRRRQALFVALVVGGACRLASAQTAPEDLSAAQLAAACAPQPARSSASTQRLRIVGAQDTSPHRLFGPRDGVVINAGIPAGVRVGQLYMAYRAVAFGPERGHLPRSIHPTGWLRITAVNESLAMASVAGVCDAVTAGDTLDVFPTIGPIDLQSAGAAGDPDFSARARVLFGAEERRIAGIGDFVLSDRGSAEGVGVGARFAVYRDTRVPGVPLVPVGEAIVASTTDATFLLRVVSARDAVESGDYLFLRK